MTTAVRSLYDLKATSLEGEPVSLARFRAKVTLAVNLASECGFTPQYAGLEKLHEEFLSRGFAVLGFPSNEFGGQEPGDAFQIREFCTRIYGVTFPMFSKGRVRPGPGQSSVYDFLTGGGEVPSWNFCKYLVGRDGRVIRFFVSDVAPESAELREAIRRALAEGKELES